MTFIVVFPIKAVVIKLQETVASSLSGTSRAVSSTSQTSQAAPLLVRTLAAQPVAVAAPVAVLPAPTRSSSSSTIEGIFGASGQVRSKQMKSQLSYPY